MPQAPERLRRKFFTKHDDGIVRCSNIIKQAGGRVERGLITFPLRYIPTSEVADAADYLVLEWDFAVIASAELTRSEPMAGADMERISSGQGELTMRFKDVPPNPGDPSNGTSLEGYEKLDYKPLWDFILTEPLKEVKKTKGGIHLPDNAKPVDDTRRCRVIKAGPGSWINGVFVPNPVKVGQYIYNMAKHMQPYRVVIDGKTYLSMPSSEVLAVADTSGFSENEAVEVLDDDVIIEE